MFTNEELKKLWSNGDKRRAFAKGFKAWGVWFTQPELDLTFYKFDLPGGSRIIVMEYLREPYQGEMNAESQEYVTNHKYYLHRGKYFSPYAASEYTIADHLKELKEKLVKGGI